MSGSERGVRAAPGAERLRALARAWRSAFPPGAEGRPDLLLVDATDSTQRWARTLLDACLADRIYVHLAGPVLEGDRGADAVGDEAGHRVDPVAPPRLRQFDAAAFVTFDGEQVLDDRLRSRRHQGADQHAGIGVHRPDDAPGAGPSHTGPVRVVDAFGDDRRLAARLGQAIDGVKDFGIGGGIGLIAGQYQHRIGAVAVDGGQRLPLRRIAMPVHDAEIGQLARCEPVYQEVPGWSAPTAGVKRFEDLPAEARAYIATLEDVCGVPVGLISTGSDRLDTILRADTVAAQWFTLPA